MIMKFIRDIKAFFRRYKSKSYVPSPIVSSGLPRKTFEQEQLKPKPQGFFKRWYKKVARWFSYE